MYNPNDSVEQRIEWATKQLLKLVRLDAPSTIKAHSLIQVLLPKLMVAIGLNECSAELATLISKGLALQTGICIMCRKNPMMNYGLDSDICGKCSADMDQFMARMEEPE